MNVITSTFIYTGLFFLFIIISGFWLRFTGKPYSMIIITIHKLIGLGAGIFLGRMVYQAYQASSLNSGQIVSVVVTVLLFIGLVATGSLMSAERDMPYFVKTIHRVLPYLTIISTGVSINLLV